MERDLTRRDLLCIAGTAMGTSLAGCGDTGSGDIDLYDQLNEDEYYIKPLTFAEFCVEDIRRSFNAIDFGRDKGENFISRGVGSADVSSSHMQGVTRLPDGWLVQSYSLGLFLSNFPAKSDAGRQPWRESTGEVETLFPYCLPSEDRGHVGGVHAYDDIVAVPSRGGGERRVELFQHDTGRAAATPCTGLTRKAKFDVSESQGAAHYASILPLFDDEWLMAVGHDSRRFWKAHKVHFYVIPSLSADQSELLYLGKWGRGNTLNDFQSLSLLAGCDKSVYLVGTGVRRAPVNSHAKLYEITAFRRSDGEPLDVEVTHLEERSPSYERNDCNFNAGATLFPTADDGLAMYCTEKEIHDGNITTREYHDEDG